MTRTRCQRMNATGRGGWPHQERRGHREAGFHSHVLLDSQKTGILCEERNSGEIVKTSGHKKKKNRKPKFCYPEESDCIHSPQMEHEGPLLMEAILWWYSLKETVDFLRLGESPFEGMKCDVPKHLCLLQENSLADKSCFLINNSQKVYFWPQAE